MRREAWLVMLLAWMPSVAGAQDFPPITYGGRAPDAPWRAEAAQRIDAIRKADMTLRVVDLAGLGIDGAEVRVRQTRQAFSFGTAVSVNLILSHSAEAATYRQRLLDLGFNMATLENGLKWVALEGEFGPSFTLPRAIQTLDWLNAHELDARGHTLVWPGVNNLPAFIDDLIADVRSGVPGADATLRQAVIDHIHEVASATDGRVVEWDVINEIGTNHDLLDLFGEPIMDDWFVATAQVTDARRFINEFNVISDQEPPKRQRYLDAILGLLDRGAPLDAIGMQGHFSATALTDIGPGSDPQTVWQVLDMFHDATGLPITITEYDLNTSHEPLKADYLRDFLTAVFAHEAVNGFVMWGFWEGRHWRPDAAMVNLDWSETPMAAVWRQLVLDEWMTRQTLVSDAQGEAALRAFRGRFEVEVEHAGQTHLFHITLDGDGQFDLTLPLTLSRRPGDFNLDGQLTNTDIQAMLDALTDLAGYKGSYGLSDADLAAIGDLDDNGAVTNGDIQGLLDLLTGTSTIAVPEPGPAGVLLTLAAVAACSRMWN